MKRIIALFCIAVMMSALLCGCSEMTNDAKKMANDAKNMANDVVSGMKDNVGTEYSNDNQGLLDDVRATVSPTDTIEESTDGISTTESNMDNMVDDGRVEDGDGNVGSLENHDGDPNIDENAAEYAQERVSADSDIGE